MIFNPKQIEVLDLFINFNFQCAIQGCNLFYELFCILKLCKVQNHVFFSCNLFLFFHSFLAYTNKKKSKISLRSSKLEKLLL